MRKILYISCLAFAVISCKDISNKIEEIAQENQGIVNTDAASAKEETAPPQAETEEEKQTRLWMEKSEGEWKAIFAYNEEYKKCIYMFGKPKKEGDIITAEYNIFANNASDHYKYKRSADGMFKIKNIKTKYENGVEHVPTDDAAESNMLKCKVHINNEGDTITMNVGEQIIFIYTRN